MTTCTSHLCADNRQLEKKGTVSAALVSTKPFEAVHPLLLRSTGPYAPAALQDFAAPTNLSDSTAPFLYCTFHSSELCDILKAELTQRHMTTT